MSQTPEVRLMKEIQLWCGQHNFIAFHTNVGKIKFWDKVQKKERFFDTGLPPGWPALMILTDKGKVIFCETKVKPNRPTKEQINTINVLVKRGFLAFVCYSIEQFIEEVSKSS